LNLEPSHTIYEFLHKPAKASTYLEHVEVVKSFNKENLKYGAVLPLYTVEYFLFFSDRIDLSLVKDGESIFYFSDLMVK